MSAREEIRRALERLSRDELNIVARKLRIKGYRRRRAEELVSVLLEKSDETSLKRALQIRWWDRHRGSVFGWASVLSLLLTFLIFVYEPSPPGTEVQPALPSGAEETLYKILIEKQIAVEDREEVIADLSEKYQSLRSLLQSEAHDDSIAARIVAYLDSGEFVRAEMSLLALKEQYKNIASDTSRKQARAAYQLGQLYELQLEFTKAQAEYRESVALDPVRADYHNGLGLVLHELGEDRAAKESFDAALRHASSASNDTTVARTHLFLGASCKALGEYGEAEAHLDKALPIFLRLYGNEHVTVAAVYNELGSTVYYGGDYRRAKEYFKKSLALRKELHGTEHPEVATSLNNLGLLMAQKGESEEGLAMLEEALRIRERIYNPQHHRVAATLANIGGVLGQLDRFEESRKAQVRALEIRRAVFGDSHPLVATSHNNVGLVLQETGALEDASVQYSKALEIRREIYGESHPDVAVSYNNLGGISRELGDLDKALELYQRALRIRRSAHENGLHPSIGILHGNIAKTWYQKSEYQQALVEYEEAYSIFQTTLGEHHPFLGLVLNGIAQVYHKLGQNEQALQNATKALDIAVEKLGGRHSSVGETKITLGQVFGALGDTTKARDHLKDALEILRERFGPSHKSTLRAKTSLDALR